MTTTALDTSVVDADERRVDLAAIRSVSPVSEVHPLWCEWSKDCQDSDYMDHRNLVTQWATTGDDVNLSMHLNRLDQMMPERQQHCGEDKIVLGIRNTAMMTPDGQPIAADVHLSENDAELLRTFLGQHLALLRHARKNLSRLQGDRDTEEDAR
jgi:hypothetical protein